MIEENSRAEQSEETHRHLTAVVNGVHVYVGGTLQQVSSVIEQITEYSRGFECMRNEGVKTSLVIGVTVLEVGGEPVM